MSTHTQPVPFAVTPRRTDSAAVIAVAGEVDLSTASVLASAIAAETDTHPTALIVDLTEVSFLASAAMTVLVHAHQKHSSKLDFSVVADGPTTSRPLKMMGLDQVFPLYPDLDTALAAVTR
ncbi:MULTISPECIES: STAS domain-containing protein [Antrihabitans]|jgi:anti-sigma B factor antagonist|uniref:Anti-sigma factor antagonist n=2 Tax=Antrihabitans TaxID=2799491 RepID=A0A934NQF0_9NOCA|nr:STAS domain-containing protein [Antrihabitans stalagmiti]MBJ8339531.1 STAS domain-containing protein [Antrihabitans stalagmiti]